jgi:hypothetical protein
MYLNTKKSSQLLTIGIESTSSLFTPQKNTATNNNWTDLANKSNNNKYFNNNSNNNNLNNNDNATSNNTNLNNNNNNLNNNYLNNNKWNNNNNNLTLNNNNSNNNDNVTSNNNNNNSNNNAHNTGYPTLVFTNNGQDTICTICSKPFPTSMQHKNPSLHHTRCKSCYQAFLDQQLRRTLLSTNDKTTFPDPKSAAAKTALGLFTAFELQDDNCNYHEEESTL